MADAGVGEAAAANAAKAGGEALGGGALGESLVGPATGTILEAGPAATGAISSAVGATPTLAELGATAIPAGVGAAVGGAPTGGEGAAAGAPTGIDASTGAFAGEVGGAPAATGAEVAPTGLDASTGQFAGETANAALTPDPFTAPPTPSTGASPSATNLPVGGADAGAAGVPGGAEGPDPLRTAVDKATGAGSGATPPAAPPGITQALQKLGILDQKGGIGQNVLPLGLALGAQAAKNASGNTLQGELKKTAAPAQATSERLLSQGASGQIPPAIMQQFNQSLKDKTAEIVQRYANMGRDAKTDSAAQAEIARATDARDAAIAKYSQDLTSQGLAAAGVASGPASQAAMAGAQQDKELQNAMASSLQQMALLEALRTGRNAPAPTAETQVP